MTGEVARVRRLGTPHIVTLRTCPVDDRHLRPLTNRSEPCRMQRAASGSCPPIGRVAARDYVVPDMGRSRTPSTCRRAGCRARIMRSRGRLACCVAVSDPPPRRGQVRPGMKMPRNLNPSGFPNLEPSVPDALSHRGALTSSPARYRACARRGAASERLSPSRSRYRSSSAARTTA